MVFQSHKGDWSGIFDRLSLGILLFDQKGGDVHLNPSARRMMGFKEDSDQKDDLSIPEFTHSPYPNLAYHLLDLLDIPSSYQEERFTIDSGEAEKKKVYSILIQPISDGNRRAGTMCILQDVTGLVEREKANEQFIASISHEIRAPLNNIKMVIDLLSSKRAGELNKTQQDFLNIADKDMDIILHTIDDLNELIEIEEGIRKFDFRWTDIKEPLQKSIDLLKGHAARKSISIDLKLPDEIPSLVIDPYRMERVFRNLIDNAIKFSHPDSKIRIEVKLAGPDDIEESEEGIDVSPAVLDCLLNGIQVMLISVKDDGIGIAPEVLEHLFDRNIEEVDRLKTPRRGFGLGLSIVKELVDDHGGSVWVKSEVDEGSCFTVALAVHNIGMEFHLAIRNEIRRAKHKNQRLSIVFLELTEDLQGDDVIGHIKLKDQIGKLRSSVEPMVPKGGKIMTFEDLGTIVLVLEKQDLLSLEDKINEMVELFHGTQVMISLASYPEDGIEEEQILLNRRIISG